MALRLSAVEPALVIADAIAIIGASLLGGLVFHLASYGTPGDVPTYLGLGVIGSVGYAALAHFLQFYSLQKFLQENPDYWQTVSAWGCVVLLLALLLFLLKLGDQVSRGAVITFCLLSTVLLVLVRKCANLLLIRAIERGVIRGRPIILIGTGEELGAITDNYLLRHYGVQEVDHVVLPPTATSSVTTRLRMVELMERAHKSRAEEIVLVTPWGETERLESVCQQLRVAPLGVRLLPDRAMRAVLNRGGQPSLLIEVQRAPLTKSELMIKRLFDIVLSLTALVVLMPLILLTVLALKLDSRGPVLFKQRRNGFGGRQFVIYKFRTMHVMEDGSVVVQARKHDPRVTRIGRLLRRTSIDELPQLFNVLKGDMSIVGPRPHALAHDNQYSQLISKYAFRSHVKPGITGWAQVNGFRGETRLLDQMKRRVDLDVWYIDNWNVGLDLKIVARTALEVLRSRNAY